MKPSRIYVVLGVLVVGVITAALLPATGPWSAIVGYAAGLSFPAFGLWLYWAFVVGPRRRERLLLTKGRSAPAVLLSFEAAGINLTEGAGPPRYGYDLTLRVEPADAAHFTARARMMLMETELYVLRAGLRLRVRYLDAASGEAAVEGVDEVSRPATPQSQPPGAPATMLGAAQAVIRTFCSATPLQWLAGTQQAQTWLLPRNPERTRIVIASFAQPVGVRDADQAAIVEAANTLLAQALWLHTDSPAATANYVNTASRRMYTLTTEGWGYDRLSPQILGGYPDERPIIAWGTLSEDGRADVLRLFVRLPGETTDHVLRAPAHQLAGVFIDWLQARGWAARQAAPGWYTEPSREQLGDYAALLGALYVQILGDIRNNVLDGVTGEFHAATLRLARAAHDALPADPTRTLACLVSASFARRAGHLTETERGAALELLPTLPEPLSRLAPLFLRVLGAAEADEALRAARSAARGAYAEWLAKVETAW